MMDGCRNATASGACDTNGRGKVTSCSLEGNKEGYRSTLLLLERDVAFDGSRRGCLAASPGWTCAIPEQTGAT